MDEIMFPNCFWGFYILKKNHSGCVRTHMRLILAAFPVRLVIPVTSCTDCWCRCSAGIRSYSMLTEWLVDSTCLLRVFLIPERPIDRSMTQTTNLRWQLSGVVWHVSNKVKVPAPWTWTSSRGTTLPSGSSVLSQIGDGGFGRRSLNGLMFV